MALERDMIEKVLMLSEKLEDDDELHEIVMIAVELSDEHDITMAAEKVKQLMDAVEVFAIVRFKRIVSNMDAGVHNRLHNARVIAQGGL